ncbi:MAG TPA: T9SS type A sorting domain-containing protein [bacterium]|jgi:hypothetical protein
MRCRYAFFLLAALWCAGLAGAATHHVPADFATIQAAIDASALHDTVLVAAGTYYENISFRGHSIVLASEYLLTHNPAAITATIINGSQPANADTGTVVRIVSGEDSTTALIGFTITGGTGTPLADQQSHLVYVEAGGVMTDGTSPIIAHNYIVGNDASRVPAGVTSAGGGGIRCGFGHPQLLNNVVARNTGRYYGGGIVINLASAILRNNVVCQNSGGQDFGGGGVWMYGSAFPASTVENNSIVGNSTTLNGGGVLISSTSVNLINNIIWANTARTTGPQISRTNSFGATTYNDVQGGLAGNGNIAVYPAFADTNLLLAAGSPCINAGDSSAIYNDPDGSRNDMGAYGGPGATPLVPFSVPLLRHSPNSVDFGFANPGTPAPRNLILADPSTGGVRIDSARIVGPSGGAVTLVSIPTHLAPYAQDTARLVWSPTQNVSLSDTLLIFTNDSSSNPARIALMGQASEGISPAGNSPLPSVFRLLQNYPNPFNPATQIRFDLPRAAHVRLEIFDLLGHHVATLLNEDTVAGGHAVIWDATSQPSGLYFCRFSTKSFSDTKKMLLLK